MPLGTRPHQIDCVGWAAPTYGPIGRALNGSLSELIY